MSMNLDREKLKELANELAKDIKTEKDLNALSAELLKMTVEAGTGPPCSRRSGCGTRRCPWLPRVPFDRASYSPSRAANPCPSRPRPRTFLRVPDRYLRFLRSSCSPTVYSFDSGWVDPARGTLASSDRQSAAKETAHVVTGVASGSWARFCFSNVTRVRY